MIQMAIKYIPKNGIPFMQVVDLTSTTSSDAGKAIATLPCYEVEWIDVVVDCATNDVTVTINPDTTKGNVATTSTALTKGTTANHIWCIINGVPYGIAASYGSNSVVLTAVSTVGGAHGVITGYVVLHGLKRK
jgi:hypothetical protein